MSTVMALGGISRIEPQANQSSTKFSVNEIMLTNSTTTKRVVNYTPYFILVFVDLIRSYSISPTDN
jgi:hypothetical protein